MSPATPQRLFRIALGIALASGAAALIHQLLWTRRLIDLLGASHESAARVFGCFFLGLALGAALAAWLAPRVSRPWRWVAGAEVAVIVLSLPAVFLPWWTAGIWPWLGPEALVDWRGGTAKLLASVIVVLPPAIAMGTTLPLLGAAVLRGDATLDRQGVWVYAVNTLGGVVGLAVVILVLLQTLGAAGSMWAAIALNVAVALASIAVDRMSAPIVVESTSPHSLGMSSDARSRTVRLACLGTAFLSGFGVLAFEVAALQAVMLVAPLSFFAPAAILMVIIALLAAGAAVTPAALRRFGSASRVLPPTVAATALAAACTPPLFFFVVERLGGLPPMPTFSLWLGKLTLLVLLSLGPAVFLAAMVFPLTLAWTASEGGDPHGRTLGWLLAANGIGGLMGAELGYRAMLPVAGPHVAIGLVAVIYAVAAIALAASFSAHRRMNLGVAGVGVAATVAAVAFWLPGLPLINQHIGMTIVEHRSGREGTVAVIDRPDGTRSILMSNQYVLGGTGVRWDQERQMHLPLLLHPAPAEVATIGLATGITPGAALQHAAVERLTPIELSPLVVDLARDHFADYHRQLFADPRTRPTVEDGRTYIAASRDRFDVVAGDLFLPWGPGEARLYTREHFEAVRRSLRPGGVYCQWLAMYQLTPGQFLSIAATFQSVFPDTHVVINGFGVRQPVLGLVGFRDAGWDWQTIRERTSTARFDGVRDPLMRHHLGVELLYLGRLAPIAAPLNTLDNMLIELWASRERVTGQPGAKYIIGRRWFDLLRELDLIAWEGRPRGREEASVLRRLQMSLPPAVADDFGHDPALWPGDPRVLGGGAAVSSADFMPDRSNEN